MEDRNIKPIGKVDRTQLTAGTSRVGSNAANRQAKDNPTANPAENVVQRLQRRIKDAKQLGFKIRREVLDGQEATWCMMGSTKVLFLDLTQTASEQFRQLNETIDSYLNHLEKTSATSGAAQDSPPTVSTDPSRQVA